MDTISLKAYAKINLGLDVLGRRADGYHEVRMIMQTVRIFDRLKLKKRHEEGISVRTNLSYLPAGADNLAAKAAALLFDEFSLEGGLDIELEKHIPVAAGMAGGSADAAAVLFGVNRMYGLGISREGLMERGVRLGADVPYCVMRGTALAEGIGEKLTTLPPLPECSIIVAKPGVSVSTKYVYENLHVDQIPEGRHPDIDGIMRALKDKDLKAAAGLMEGANILETVTVQSHPVIGELKEVMNTAGALVSLMSGSGPSVFGIFEDKEKASKAMPEIRESRLARQLFLTEPYNPAATRRTFIRK